MQYKLLNPEKTFLQPIEQILQARGITDIKHFLNTTEQDVYDPMLLANMSTGIKMLITHISKNDDIYIQVDSDTDGFTSSSLLINYLNCVFPFYIQNHVYYGLHEDKTHGLDTLNIPNGVKLIIIPDAGSAEYELHAQMKQNGIDVLILDHHEADKMSSDACVINNQLCDYPNKALSGVGVVYKFCCQLDKLLGVNYVANYVDLVALGLIADMVDSRVYETQYLIQNGLQHVRNPLFKELMGRDSMHFKNDTPYMIDVAWYVAPLINAMTRVGEMEEKILLFESMLEFKSYEKLPSTKRGATAGALETRVEQAARVASNVKSRQNKIVDNSLLIITDTIINNHLDDNKFIIIQLENGQLSKNLNGLVANKISGEYQRPSAVLQKIIEDGIIYWEGSARGYDKSTLEDFRQFLIDSGLVEWAAGHKSAFGVRIKDENIKKLTDYCNKNLIMIDGNIYYSVDFIWNVNELNPDIIFNIASYRELWGQNIIEPYVVLENVRLDNDSVSILGKNQSTLKITTPKIDIMKMYISDEEKQDLVPNGETWFANIVATCDINEFLGNKKPQLKLVDYEIIKKCQWYF